ncbi:TPA: hypothetical protein DIC40_08290 [Patescibacteria group bacterium]|nr:hypothetical protein P148_SR1C00001G0162 [candidate division SR1 bacterium RAAC1_SR1_1]HCY21782.1 hypothetical protein [Candidatus Gracilibacteria bacterium]
MAFDFDGFRLDKIINPNAHCTHIVFISVDNPDIHTKTLILFDNQIKYMQVNEHQNFIRVKIFMKSDDTPIAIDFEENQKELYELFLKSVTNK